MRSTVAVVFMLLVAGVSAQTDDDSIQRGYLSHATYWNSCEVPLTNETCLLGNNIPTTMCRRTNDRCHGTNQNYAIILLTDYVLDGCHHNLWLWSCANHWLSCENGTTCACVDVLNQSSCVCDDNVTHHHCLPEHVVTLAPTARPTTPTTLATSTLTSTPTSTLTTTIIPTPTSAQDLTSRFSTTPTTLADLTTTLCPIGNAQSSTNHKVVEKTPWWIPVVCIVAGAVVGAIVAVFAQRKMAPSHAPSPDRPSFYNPVYCTDPA